MGSCEQALEAVVALEETQYDGNRATRKVYQWEIPNGQFVGRYRLPNFVQQEQASATYKDGVLTISFPKREEAKARRIEINV